MVLPLGLGLVSHSMILKKAVNNSLISSGGQATPTQPPSDPQEATQEQAEIKQESS